MGINKSSLTVWDSFWGEGTSYKRLKELKEFSRILGTEKDIGIVQEQKIAMCFWGWWILIKDIGSWCCKAGWNLTGVSVCLFLSFSVWSVYMLLKSLLLCFVHRWAPRTPAVPILLTGNPKKDWPLFPTSGVEIPREESGWTQVASVVHCGTNC